MEIDAKSNDRYISPSAAANHGHLPIVESLKHGADETARDKRSTNVLMKAVDIGHVDLVCWLMQNIKHTDMKPNEVCHSSNVAVKFDVCVTVHR